MSSPTPPDLPDETRAAPARTIKPLVWILGGTGLLLVCATLTVGIFAVRAVKNAGFAFRFDPAMKTLVMMGATVRKSKYRPPAMADTRSVRRSRKCSSPGWRSILSIAPRWLRTAPAMSRFD